MVDDDTLRSWARAATAGDRTAAERLLAEVEESVYRLALRMLGHPQDAEDAAQEILLVVVTHLASFRGESSFRTWCWRIASRHLLRTRRGRREAVTFASMSELLERDEQHQEFVLPEGEDAVFAREVRLRCTEGMLLSLDRDHRIAFVLTELLGLSGDEAADALEIAPVLFRKRLSRARLRLIGFLRHQCGLFDPTNPCRCEKQAVAGAARGQLIAGDLSLATHPVRDRATDVARCVEEVDELVRASDLLRHPDYATPSGLAQRVRSLVNGEHLELLHH